MDKILESALNRRCTDFQIMYEAKYSSHDFPRPHLDYYRLHPPPSHALLESFSETKMDFYHYDPDAEIENSVKSIFEIRIPIFCYIQVIVFDLSYLPVAAVWT